MVVKMKLKITSVGMTLLVILASTLAMPSGYPDRDVKKPKDALLPYLIGKYSYTVLNLMQL